MHFDEQHAIQYGVDEAIMISNLRYWLKHNKANKKHFYDGRYWTYNSVEAFGELFKFWTSKQLRRIMESLVSQGIIMRGNYNKSNMDRTGWYAFVNEDAFLGIDDLPKRENASTEKGEPIPNSNTDIKHSSKDELIDKLKKPKKSSKISVLMRDSIEVNIDAVKMALFGTIYEKANIEFYYECALAWSDSKGEKSKDWVATIRNFILRDYKAGKMVTGTINQSQKINGITEAIENWDDL